MRRRERGWLRQMAGRLGRVGDLQKIIQATLPEMSPP